MKRKARNKVYVVPWLFFFLCCPPLLHGQNTKEYWLNELNKEMANSKNYDAAKAKKIDSLANSRPGPGARDQFHYCEQLFNEYAVYHFDSAYAYARQMQVAAEAANDSILRNKAILRINSVLLSSGMFKEVFESLSQIDPAGLDNPEKARYYTFMARSYFDLADYNNDSIFSPAYNAAGERFIDSCLLISEPASFAFLYYNGLKSLRTNDVWTALRYFRQLIDNPSLTLHEQAIANSTFSDIYIRRGLPDSAIILLSRAAIADIKSSTKETTAILHLASLLFNKGDVKNASHYIQRAASDAKVYGARQRMVQLSNIMPLIEAERLSLMEQEKYNVVKYAVILTLSFAFLVGLIIVVIRQLRKLRHQQAEIQQKNISLHHLVQEKEWLLKEIHHRVKNNLHTITSLLESQSAYLENEALEAIRNSQHRVFAMSLVHQKLYQPEKTETGIDMSVYIHELVNYLRESFETGDSLRFVLDLEPVELDFSRAVPMGLILNEAITNSVKHAFGKNKTGTIAIVAKATANGTYLFSVSDNGIGLPGELRQGQSNSLGMKLMIGLSEDINGKLTMENKKGTRITVEIPAHSNPGPFHPHPKNN